MSQYSKPYKSEEDKKVEYYSNILNSLKVEVSSEVKQKILVNFIDSFPTTQALSNIETKQKLQDVLDYVKFGNELLSLLSKDFDNLLFTVLKQILNKKPILNFLTEETINQLIENENFNYVDPKQKSFLNFLFFKQESVQNGVSKKIGKLFNIQDNHIGLTSKQLKKIIEKADVNILDESEDNALYNLFLNYDADCNLVLENDVFINLIEKTDFTHIPKTRHSVLMNAFNNLHINLKVTVIDKIIDKGFKENPHSLVRAIIFNKNTKLVFSQDIVEKIVDILNKDEALKKNILKCMFELTINKNCLYPIMYDFIIDNSTVKYNKSQSKDNLFHYLLKEDFFMNDEIFNKFVQKNIHEVDELGDNIFSFLLGNLNRKYNVREDLLNRFVNELDINKNNKYKDEGVNTIVHYSMKQKKSGIKLNDRQLDIFINKIDSSIKDFDGYNILHNIFHHMGSNDYRLNSKQLFKLAESIDISDVTNWDKTLGHFYIIGEVKSIPEDFLQYVFDNINPLIKNINGNNFIESYFIREVKKIINTENIVILNDPYIAKILNTTKIPDIKPWIEEVLKNNFYIEPYFLKGIINQIEPHDLFKINNKNYLNNYSFDTDSSAINVDKLKILQEKNDGKNKQISFSLVCLHNIIKNNNGILFGYKENIDTMKDILVKFKGNESNKKIKDNKSFYVSSEVSYLDYLLEQNKPINKDVWTYVIEASENIINHSILSQKLISLLAYQEKNSCIEKKDLAKIFSKVREDVISSDVMNYVIHMDLIDILPPKLLNNMEVAYEALKNNKDNFIKLGTIIKDELKLDQDNSYDVLHKLLKKDNKMSFLLNKNKIKKLQENINKRIIQENSKVIENKDVGGLIDNMLNINDQLKKIKENTSYINEIQDDISDINRGIYKDKLLLIEKLLRTNNLDFEKIKDAADKIEKIKNETKETLQLKIKSEASVIKYIQKM